MFEEIQESATNAIFNKVEMHYNLGVFLSIHVSIQSKEKEQLVAEFSQVVEQPTLERRFSTSPCLYYHRYQNSVGWRRCFRRVGICDEPSGEAKLGWPVNEQRRILVTIWNILIDLRDVGGERVVTLEPDPRHVDLLKNICGLYTEFSVCYCSIQISYDAAGIRCSRHPCKSIVGVWIRLKRDGRCIHGHSGWIPKFPMHE